MDSKNRENHNKKPKKGKENVAGGEKYFWRSLSKRFVYLGNSPNFVNDGKQEGGGRNNFKKGKL